MTGINITPLVDVLLVLLIIFMMQSIPKSKAIDLALPRGDTTTVLPPPRTLLSVGVDARIRLEGASIAPEDLRSEQVALKRRAPEATLALEPERGCRRRAVRTRTGRDA